MSTSLPALAFAGIGLMGLPMTRRLLAAAGFLHASPVAETQRLHLFTTGDLKGLQAAAKRWLGLPPHLCQAVPASQSRDKAGGNVMPRRFGPRGACSPIRRRDMPC